MSRVHSQRRLLAAIVSLIVAAATFQSAPTFAAPRTAPPPTPRPQVDPVVPGHVISATAPAKASPKQYTAPAPTWPAENTVDVDLSASVAQADARREPSSAAAGAQATPRPVRAGSGPIWLTASAGGAVRLHTYPHAQAVSAGLDGILIGLTGTSPRPPGNVGVTVDYTAFAGAYGADWSSRLRLVEVPGCALRSPVPAGCRLTPLASHNNAAQRTVTANVAIPAAVPSATTPSATTPSATAAAVNPTVLVAAVAGPSGGAGSFAATSLSSAGTWSAGGSSGDFDWSYPLRTPPGLGGPVPALSLSYSSQSVDGQMATTNNQPSWVGEGFSFDAGYLERRYKTCSEDMGGSANNTVATGDDCWATDNATLSMSGHAGELLKDPNDPNRWHLRGDDGTYIRHLTGAGNGDNNGEWWIVTTTDGSQYWFGGRPSSNSTLTVPVFGNNPGEPCHATDFASSSCTQAWRWNLDHVVDPSGNTMTYFYTKETNKYARNQTPTDAATYDRASYLTRIEYGTRDDTPGTAPMRVSFTAADRCLSSCSTHDSAHWPDTPWDQECAASPCFLDGPTFWTTKRLASITTELWSGTGTTYKPVTTWTLTHQYLDPGDGTQAGLWLSSIAQTGKVGTATTVAPVTFTGVQLANRVNPHLTTDGLPPMNWFRIADINTESGGQIQVSYSAPQCVAGVTMPDPAHLENNTLRCYPVKWTPPGSTGQVTDFFHKYVVTQVNTVDLVTPANPTTVTKYEYVGPAAWHFADDDGLITSAQKTWSVWRGYGDVKVHTGIGSDETVTESLYLRGMNGDHLPGGTRAVQAPAVDVNLNGSTADAGVDVPAVNDDDAYAGMTRESITYNGSAEVSAQIIEPWESAPTASRTIDGIAVTARFTGAQASHQRTDLDGGRAPRTTSSRTTFDAFGMPVQTDNNGDDAVGGDESCALVDYARNDPSDGSVWLVNYPYRQRSFPTTCARAAQSGLTSAEVSADTISYYDGSPTPGDAPTKGHVTRVDTLTGWVSGAPVYQTAASSTFDANGRVTAATDARGNTTTTSYAVNAGGQLATMTSTTALGWVTTTTIEPAFGLDLTVTDPNGRVTSQTYDGLGRLLAVWKPGRDKATQSPSSTYTYTISTTAPTVVSSSDLTPSGGYVTSYTYYDGLLRSRQTQAPRGDGTAGTIVTDTFYDTAGRAWKTYSPYLAPITPGSGLFVANEQGDVPARTENRYDGAGRTTGVISYDRDSSGAVTEFSRVTTYYAGDRVDVTPPAGGTATSTYTDARGNTTQVRQYHGPAPTPDTAGSYDATTYTFNSKTQMTSVTDPSGNRWNYTYDLLGRVIQISNPNSGTITSSYDATGDVVSTTDARGVTLVDTYDSLGRKTGLYQGSVSAANQLAGWTYDALTNSRGQLTKSIRYESGNAYTTTVNGFTAAYQPTSVTYTIPAAETGLAGSYTYVYTYNVDGSPATTRIPDVDGSGGLTIETLTQQYTALGQPAGLQTSVPTTTTLVPSLQYTGYGELAVTTLQTNGGPTVHLTNTYAEGTRRLIEQQTTRQNAPTTLADAHYTYDVAGNLLKAADTATSDNQCYSYDYLDRLTSAWTPATGDCTAAKSGSALGGPAPYWTDWTYGVSGNRASQVEHSTSGATRTTTYTDPAAGTAQPHTLTGTTTQDGTGTHTAAYGYDPAGDLVSRPSPNGTANQSLTWDAEGHLATITDNGATTSYLYDAAGARLIARDGTGKTLYLPDQELRYTAASGARATTRYYSEAGQEIAMRTAGGLTWLAGDRQGTTNLTIDAVSQSYALRRQDPYGNARGTTTGSWPAAMTQGFLGGTSDPSGLTHLGAREYDPVTGRFISPDPRCDPKDPQGLDAYAYSHDNPIGRSDPSGLDSGSGWQWVGTTRYSFDAGGYHYNVVIYHFLYCTNDMRQCLGGWDYIDGKGNFKEVGNHWFNMDCNDSCMYHDIDKLTHGDWQVAQAWLYGLDITEITRTPLCVPPPAVIRSASGFGPAPDGAHGCNWADFGCMVANPGTYFSKNGMDLLTGGAILAGGVACILVSLGACAPAAVAAGAALALDQYADHGRYEANGGIDLAFNLGMAFIPEEGFIRGDIDPDLFIVLGGTKDVPPPGVIFSGAYGRTLPEAAAGVPHNQIRWTTVGDILYTGGNVDFVPELSRGGNWNFAHVNICLGDGPCPFGPLMPNPVAKADRIK